MVSLTMNATESQVPSPDRPESYSRRVLVTVSGLTPQIITETLYALSRRDPPFIPTEVQVITTELGRQKFVAAIEKFRQFFRDYDLPVPRCDPGDLYVVAGPDGQATDVRTPADNEHVGNLIMQRVLELTSDPNCAVHASIAGGRKTMGFYLGYLMSMFGRDQDRISHVLVNEAFENEAAFYYPPRQREPIQVSDGRKLLADDHSVLLSEIPFIRHRGGFSEEDLRRQGMSFQQAVGLAQKAIVRTELVIDIMQRKVLAGDIEVRMQHNPLAFLAWVAAVRMRGMEAVHCSDSPEEFLSWYERVLDDAGSVKFEETKRALRNGFEEEDFRFRVHAVNAAFRRALGASRASEYSIKLLKKRSGRYSLSLPGTVITLRGTVDA
jgi:CRISPR-associated protein (TIGR02584 family)